MKKWIYPLVLVLLLAQLSGCTQASAQEQEPQEEGLPQGYTEVYGKVRSAYGNEITLVIGTMGQAQQGGGTADAPGSELPQGDMETAELESDGQLERQSMGGSAEEMDDAQRLARAISGDDRAGELPSGQDSSGSTGFPGGEGMPTDGQAPSGFSGGEAGEGSRGGRDRGQGGGSPGGGSAVTLQYTGDEETFLIPVTAAITTGMGENARTVRFTQIAEKNILRMVLDENGVIVSIQILG